MLLKTVRAAKQSKMNCVHGVSLIIKVSFDKSQGKKTTIKDTNNILELVIIYNWKKSTLNDVLSDLCSSGEYDGNLKTWPKSFSLKSGGRKINLQHCSLLDLALWRVWAKVCNLGEKSRQTLLIYNLREASPLYYPKISLQSVSDFAPHNYILSSPPKSFCV